MWNEVFSEDKVELKENMSLKHSKHQNIAYSTDNRRQRGRHTILPKNITDQAKCLFPPLLSLRL